MKWIAAPLMAAVLVGTTACASAGATTCREFGAMSDAEQFIRARQMVKDHGLDPESNTIGMAKLVVEVTTFCGIPLGKRAATKNLSREIGSAIDWSRYGG